MNQPLSQEQLLEILDDSTMSEYQKIELVKYNARLIRREFNRKLLRLSLRKLKLAIKKASRQLHAKVVYA